MVQELANVSLVQVLRNTSVVPAQLFAENVNGLGKRRLEWLEVDLEKSKKTTKLGVN